MSTDAFGLLPPNIIERNRRMSRFYDRRKLSELKIKSDFTQPAEGLADRWRERVAPFNNLLEPLVSSHCHDQERRARDGSGSVDEDEFVASRTAVMASFHHQPEQARILIERAAGSFFDVLISMRMATLSRLT